MGESDRYEIVSYPKLRHVGINFVHLFYRNQHVHRELEIGLVLEGTAEVHVKTKRFIAREGSLFLFNSNEPHEISTQESGAKIAYIQLANNFCEEYFHLLRNIELEENDLSNYLTPKQNRQVIDLMLRVIGDYYDEGVLNTLSCFTGICQLIRLLLEMIPFHELDEASYLSKARKTARLRRITEYIDNNFLEKVTLEQIAKQEGVTITYLSHFIHDNLNMNFQDYVNNIRFEKALILMSKSRRSLTDVALESGFSDVKYLNRQFEKRFGCTSKEYLQQKRAFRSDNAIVEETQHFAGEDIGRKWLENFRDHWLNLENK